MKHEGWNEEEVGFVFVGGAGLDPDIWRNVADALDRPCLAIRSPARSCDPEFRRGLSIEDYAVHMKNQVENWGTRKFILVAHSLGGVFALRLAAEFPDRVAGFVAVGAAIPNNGGSFLSVLPFPKRALLSILLRIAGTKPPESAIRTGLCNDLTADQAQEVVDRFVPESVRAYTDRVDVPVPDVPKMYVRLTEDKEFGESLQNRMIANLNPQSVRHLPTGHLPMLRDPMALRLLLEEFLHTWS